jgi:small GTP-binding protein
MATLVSRSSVWCFALMDGERCDTGKTCAFIRFAQRAFPEDYIPTVLDAYSVELHVTLDGEEQKIALDFWDTAGQEEYDRLRPLSYTAVDVVLLCFSIVDPVSYQNIRRKWYNEVC